MQTLNECLRILGFKQHNEMVKEFFKNDPNLLLILCWERGDGWDKLCPFLNKEVLTIDIIRNFNPKVPRYFTTHKFNWDMVIKILLTKLNKWIL